MRLLDAITGRYGDTFNEYQASGATVVTYSYGQAKNYEGPIDIIANATRLYKENGVVFAAILARIMLFSEVKFVFQSKDDGILSNLPPRAEILENPWPNGTTGELLARMLQDVDLAGNAFIWDNGEQLVRLDPRYMTIVSEEAKDEHGRRFRRLIGYYFDPDMTGSLLGPGENAEFFDKAEVAHWSPVPDPQLTFRGMSWLTPVLREILSDSSLTEYKIKYLENAAAQPLDARIATPSGFVPMGDIRPGSRVLGADGEPRRVLGVFPQGEKDVYRLTFAGGATTECCEDHMWTVRSTANRSRGAGPKAVNMTLRQIMNEGLQYPCGKGLYKWTIPMCDPVEFDDPGPLPLDPYLLGVLLGDGSFVGPTVTLASH